MAAFCLYKNKKKNRLPVIIAGTLMVVLVFFAVRGFLPGWLVQGARALSEMQSSLTTSLKQEFLKLSNTNTLINEQAAQLAAQEILLQRHLADLQKLHSLESRLIKLEGLLRLKNSSFPSSVAASVISRSPSSWHSELIISKGSQAKIREGQVVITTRGLLGQIQSVKPNYSIVQLLSGSQVRFGGVDRRSGVMGIVYGTKPGKALLKFVPIGSDVKPGDSIFTTSLSQSIDKLERIFPYDYPVGRVHRVRKDKNNAELLIEIILNENGSRAHDVMVLVPEDFRVEPVRIPSQDRHKLLPQTKTTSIRAKITP